MQSMLIAALVMVACAQLAMAADEAMRPSDRVKFPAPWTSPYRVDPKWPYHLVNDENQHLFIMNRTGWAYFGCKDPEGFLDRSKALGCNVIRVTLEGQPYLPELGIDLWPWAGTREKPDYTAFNDKYWDEVERRIKLAGDKGIGIDLTLYFTLKPKAEEADTQRLFWQQTIKRLGKYANILTWEIHNEYLGNEAFQDAAGNFFAQNDPYHRPVCTSDVTTNDAAWPKKEWVTLAINHSCTSSGLTLGSKRKHLLDDWYLTVARSTRSHGKPAWCNESGREKRHKNDDGVHRRKQGWIWTMAGCYWTWHSWDGCEGIDDPKYRAPGAEFVPMYAKFWTSLPFWTLSPDDKSIALDQKGVICTALSDKDKNLLVAYLCLEKTGTQAPPMALAVTLPDGDYGVTLARPADLHVIAEQNITAHDGKAAEVKLTGWTDDLIVRIERKPGK